MRRFFPLLLSFLLLLTACGDAASSSVPTLIPLIATLPPEGSASVVTAAPLITEPPVLATETPTAETTPDPTPVLTPDPTPAPTSTPVITPALIVSPTFIPISDATSTPVPATIAPTFAPAVPPASTPTFAPVVTQAPQGNSRTVYRTDKGTKYHYANPCGNGVYYAVTLEDAIAAGLTACKKCAQ